MSSRMPSGGYAVVEDVPASWDAYLQRVEAVGGGIPAGLLVHIAGRTDEGFRVIELWESQAAWERAREGQPAGLDRPIRGQHIHTTSRDFTVQRLILGRGF